MVISSRIPTHVKFCMPEFKKMMEFDEGASSLKQSSLLFSTGNFILGMIGQIVNFTLVKSNEESKLINSETGEYGGCFGKLQRGEADTAFPYVAMPIIGIDNVTQLNATNSDIGVYILSPYLTNVSTSHSYSDLLEQFKMVSVEVWSDALVLTLVFWSLLVAIKRLYQVARKVARFRKLQDDPLYGQPLYYQVATHMLQTETCDYLRLRERYVSILMSFFAFFFITLFTNMMTTSKVSARSFFAYDTYEKIFGNKKVQPVWPSNFMDYSFYRDAPDGSQMRKMWDQSVRISEEAKTQGMKKPPVISTDPNYIVGTFANLAQRQEIVLFFSNSYIGVFLGGSCFIIPQFSSYENLRYKATKDTHVQPRLRAVPVSVHSKVLDGIHFLTRISFEHAFFSGPMLQSAIIDGISTLAPGMGKKDKKYLECMQYQYKFPEDEAETVALIPKNFSYLFYLCLTSYTVALFLLLKEHQTANKNRVKVFIEPKSRFSLE